MKMHVYMSIRLSLIASSRIDWTFIQLSYMHEEHVIESPAGIVIITGIQVRGNIQWTTALVTTGRDNEI